MTRLFVCFIACSIAAALVAPGCKLQKKESVSPDELAARKVVELVDSIHTHTWSPETDAACDAARDAWAALTPEQKALVHGEFASREFFEEGVDAPEPDDPLNADGIGANEILVVSFGTSFNESRVEDIGAIEKAIAAAYPDWSVRRAFTAQIIVNHVQARDGEKIDNIEQALDRAVANGVKNLVVQPTLLMHGAEYDEAVALVKERADSFESVRIALERLAAQSALPAAVITGVVLVYLREGGWLSDYDDSPQTARQIQILLEMALGGDIPRLAKDNWEQLHQWALALLRMNDECIMPGEQRYQS